MQAFWFGVIAVLWAGFFMLEGFDFGVGILLPVVGRTDEERRIALRSIGPVWDGNEVWLLVAGGATFAAFPDWYASVFSGFYLAFALLLLGLILRGIGIEYREKADTAAGRRWCDWAIVSGSLLPALLLGVAFADFLRGVTMDSSGNVTGTFFDLVGPYALLGGLTTLILFILHGALFLTLRTVGPVQQRAQSIVTRLGIVTIAVAVVFVIWSSIIRRSPVSVLLGLVMVLTIGAGVLLSRTGKDGRAFAATAVAALLFPIWMFSALWPDVLPARNNPAFSLTVHNASSTHYTLVVMTVVALIFTPLVLVYQAWTYWVFRARVTGAESGGYHDSSPLARGVAAAEASARETLGLPGADAPPEPAPDPR